LKYLSLYERKLCLAALLIHLVAAWFTIGFHHPDEHYQIVEMASYKLGQTPANMLPWEFAARMRPGLQPFISFVLLKCYYATGADNPYTFSFLLRLLSTGLAFVTAIRFHLTVRDSIRSEALQRLHLFLSVLAWGLVYLHVRFSSENWSAMCFAWAIIFLLRESKMRYWWFGLFAGLSFVFRFQSGFFIAGAGLWMLLAAKTKFPDLVRAAAAFLLVFGLGAVADRWLYGEWVLSSWAYLDQNIIQNKAAGFGTEPWYWYLIQALQLTIPPFSLVLLFGIAALILYRPRHILSWSIIAFLLGHFAVGHKEFRFLFPLAFFLPFIAVTALEYWQLLFPRLQQRKGYRTFVRVFTITFWIVNGAALLLMSLKPANDNVAFNKYLYDDIKESTIVIYSTNLSPCLSDQKKGWFFKNRLIMSYPIKDVRNDTTWLQGKRVMIFSEHPFRKDEPIFQHGGTFFDSSRTSLHYSNLPRWIYHFNYNNWIERSNCYSLYLLDTRR
jgi:GPI mannosyltransferase 3